MGQINLDIVFFGGLFPKGKEQEIVSESKGFIQYAANALQWSIVEGLDANLKKPIKIINSLYIGSFPKRYKKLFVKTYKFNHTSNSEDINVGFINFMGLKHVSRYLSLKPHLKQWAKDKGTNPKIIIAYALTNVFVNALKYIKKINPDIVTVMIVPDLPQYMNTSTKRNIVYSFLKQLSMRDIFNKLEYIDCFVLLTSHMKEILNISPKQYFTVVEGIATDIYKNTSHNDIDSNTKTIVYTGTLNQRYGILNLLEAFKEIPNPNYRLILCGDGDSKDKVQKACNDDNRIIYMGLLRREAVLDIQSKATVLVNPRQNNEEFTKYSFPSKIMEYMSSGRPVIAYKLDGMPDEYYNYIYYVDGNSVEDLKNKIIEVCEKPKNELDLFGEKAKEFVLREKNKAVQAKKVIEMICQFLDDKHNAH